MAKPPSVLALSEQLGGGGGLITSTGNSTIKLIRGLRARKERDRQGRYFVEGIRVVGEAVQNGATIDLIVVAPGLLTSEFALNTVEEARRDGVPTLAVSDEVFGSLSLRDGPQGIGAIIRQRWEPLSSLRPQGDDLWVALEAVQDPGNLGTILRTADAVGARGVILVGQATDPYDPVAVRASMGSVFAQRLGKATVSEFLAWRRATRVSLVGTSGAGATGYRKMTYPTPLVLISGSERQGLSFELLESCDAVVQIPMVGRPDSLNLAVATSVVLYEIFAQRHPA